MPDTLLLELCSELFQAMGKAWLLMGPMALLGLVPALLLQISLERSRPA